MAAQEKRESKRGWPLVVLAIVMLVLGIGVWRAVAFLQETNEVFADAYAAMDVGYTIVRYIDDTDDWPQGWDDLATHSGKDQDWIQYVSKHVAVDWDADLEALAAADSYEAPPFPVVTCPSGVSPGPNYEQNANHAIYRVLQERNRSPSSQSDAPQTPIENGASQ